MEENEEFLMMSLPNRRATLSKWRTNVPEEALESLLLRRAMETLNEFEKRKQFVIYFPKEKL